MLGVVFFGEWTGNISISYLFNENTINYWLLCLWFFLLQLTIAIIIDRGCWKRYPLLIMIAPFYPFYFWFILFTSFLMGFPKGFLRYDQGKWHRTIRLTELK